MSLVTVQRSPSGTGSYNTLSDDEEENSEKGRYEKSESFFTGKGTALILALREIPHHIVERKKCLDPDKCSGNILSANLDIQQHLQSMFYLLRHEDTLKMAVKLESQRPHRTRYLAIVSRPCYKKNNSLNMSSSESRLSMSRRSKKITYQKETESEQQQRDSKIEGSKQHAPTDDEMIASEQILQADDGSDAYDSQYNNKNSTNKRNTICDISAKESSSRTDPKELEESCLLGIDCNEKTTIGLVLKVLADTTIRLDGDGGFSISVYGKTHIFKPVSVQAMWSALQTLHRVSQKARDNNFYPGGPSHEWVSYYESRIDSDRSCLNEWNAMDSIESRRPPSPDAAESRPTKREETKQVIRMKLKEIMMCVDLDEVTSKIIRSRLEQNLGMDLGEFKSFIDEEMLTILGQMDAPTEIFDHVYLGSEWNASNLDELQKNGVRHILNVTREIDNFFPGMFDYFNVREYDDEKTNLLKHWDNTFKYISRAKEEGSKVLVHCKMGVSRSASVVIAYAMKAYNWDFDHALQHVKKRRSCIKPNKSFLAQLETYRGMLDAMQNKEKLQRSKSETNLKASKDARLIPGSEPTPLIQALNNLQKSPEPYSKSIRSTIKRSNSSLSKNFEAVNNITAPTTSSSISKHQSFSLEDLVSHNSTCHDQRNVRYPATNGQNYSLTQNQILHIQRNSSVKTIVSELETQKDKQINKGLSSFPQQDDSDILKVAVNKPKEGTVVDENLIWTSSSQLIRQSMNIEISPNKPFNPNEGGCSITGDTMTSQNQKIGAADYFSSHLDNIFENEETKSKSKSADRYISNQSWMDNSLLDAVTTTAVVSRQSSCSSVDSAVILGYSGDLTEIPSRQSSWGSGDNRVLPSRNSSWGSYDTSKSTLSAQKNFKQLKKYPDHGSDTITIIGTRSSDTVQIEKDLSCNTGTVKRTKQKLEGNSSIKKLCGDENTACETTITAPLNSDFSGKYVVVVGNDIGRSSSSSITAGTSTTPTNRSNSEEIIFNAGGCSWNVQKSEKLSASAPEPSSIEKFASRVIHCKKKKQIQNKDNNNRIDNNSSYAASHVQNLKKNFEAKANVSSCKFTNKNKVQSLPSSPIASHSGHNKDLNVKELVTKYQASEQLQPSNVAATAAVLQQHQQHTISNRIRPRSFYESRNTQISSDLEKAMKCNKSLKDFTSIDTTTATSTSDYNHLQLQKFNNEISRPPPIPPIPKIPIVDHHISSMTDHGGILSEKIHQRKVQYYGKTHPLARLSFCKKKLNAATTYNTM